MIAGSGVNLGNVRKQFEIVDGIIIGSYFKPMENTRLPVEEDIVREFMQTVCRTRSL